MIHDGVRWQVIMLHEHVSWHMVMYRDRWSCVMLYKIMYHDGWSCIMIDDHVWWYMIIDDEKWWFLYELRMIFRWVWGWFGMILASFWHDFEMIFEQKNRLLRFASYFARTLIRLCWVQQKISQGCRIEFEKFYKLAQNRCYSPGIFFAGISIA